MLLLSMGSMLSRAAHQGKNNEQWDKESLQRDGDTMGLILVGNLVIICKVLVKPFSYQLFIPHILIHTHFHTHLLNLPIHFFYHLFLPLPTCIFVCSYSFSLTTTYF